MPGQLPLPRQSTVEDRRITSITYQSLQAAGPATYDICPCGMIYQRGWLYVVFWSPRRQRLRHWKIDCIERVALAWLESRRAEGFDPREHWVRSFGVFHGESEVHVRVRFWTMAARCVQDGRWHRRRKLTRQAQGSILAEFDLSSSEEIKHWILGFGRHATVFAPQRLRQQMKDGLRAMAFQNMHCAA